jgi:electron transport complex protein RnfB
MAESIYEKVADAVNARTGYPCLKGPELYAILEFLYTPEEGELALKMPLKTITAEKLAQNIGESSEKVRGLLESMADKALVFTDDSRGGRRYVLMPLLPGTFEVHFMRGGTDERTQKLARLFQNYFAAVDKVRADKTSVSAMPRVYSSVPFSRVISVEELIPAGVQIHPYDRVSKYIDEHELISIGTCYCRHYGELLGNPCTKPKDNCFSFGQQAKFMIERGFNKAVTKQEALRVLDEAEKAGLVHCSSNTSESINFICNCCTCHCGIMASIKVADSPNAAAESSFVIHLDEDECIGCGECVERCQVKAIGMEDDDDKAVLVAGRCIGCGLCVSTCSTEALRLVPREDAPVPPRTLLELNVAMISSYKDQKEERAKEKA